MNTSSSSCHTPVILKGMVGYLIPHGCLLCGLGDHWCILRTHHQVLPNEQLYYNTVYVEPGIALCRINEEESFVKEASKCERFEEKQLIDVQISEATQKNKNR